MAEKKKRRLWALEVIFTAVSVGIALLPPPAGLERQAMVFFGILAWSIASWVIGLFPSYATGLIMLALLVLTGCLTFQQAFSVFSGTTFWLVLGVFAIGGAVSKTGLLNRLCYRILGLFPPTYDGQVLAMLLGGLVIGPAMPSTTAKVAIAGSFGTRIGELLGFEDRSRGMTGLYCAMYTGFCLTAPLWLTATFWSYLITGLLTPEEAAPFGFGGWFLAMLPWAAAVVAGSYLIIKVMYRARAPHKLEKDTIRALAGALGPVSGQEKVTGAVLAVCVVFWCLERAVGIDAAVTAVLGTCALMIAGVITTEDLKGWNWPTLLYIGEILILSTCTSELGINDWMGETFGAAVGPLLSSPYVLVLLVGVATQAMHFVIVAGSSCITILLVILIPFLRPLGIDPWFAGIVSLAMAQPWYLPYMNANALSAYAAAGGEEKLRWNSTVPYCLAYHILALLALAASVPYWQALGIL